MEAPTLNVPLTRIEAEVRRVREILKQSEYAQALAAAQKLIAEVPANRDVLYMIAVSQRYLGRIPDALATLTELEKHHSRYGRLFQERGHCYVALRSAGPAINAFLRAVLLNPSLPASWKALHELYKIAGEKAYAEDAAAHIANLEAIPPEIVTAFSMYADGEVHAAELAVRGYLMRHGNHVEGMRLLAKIGMDSDVVDDAEFLLEKVIYLAPQHDAARYEYVIALLQRHKHVRAQEEIAQLLVKEPNNRAYRTTYATICAGLGNYDLALPLYREILAETSNDAELLLSIAHALKTLGRTDEAIYYYHSAIEARPGFGEAYWSLANLKTYKFSDPELQCMRNEEARPGIALKDRYHFCFALGKALEDRAGYPESFAYYVRGNSQKKTECRYRPEFSDANTRLQKEVCTREFFALLAGVGSQSRAPIFIVGLPRSGSTLIEQILASHSQIEGTMELADIPRLVQELQGRDSPIGAPRYPSVLARLDPADFKRFGDRYLSDTLVYRTGKPIFIDKMPNNFRHLGLIHLILPNAKIIDARREPIACCFSNYKQLFASGQQFTYSLEDIAHYYRRYVELMDHWMNVLPGKILQVRHEELVESFDEQVRRILQFCGVDFEPACIEFYKTRRTVHTASSEQVRRPINSEGLNQWRHFEPWLEPLKLALSR